MKTLLKEIKEALTKGQWAVAEEKLGALKLSKLTREDGINLASVARWAGKPELTIQILNPIVHPKEGKPIRATSTEKTVYAGALIKVGAIEEALHILKTVNTSEVPDALLFKGHACLFQWDHTSGIEPFTQYLLHPKLELTQRIFGKLNLAACYLGESRLKEASEVLAELRKETEGKEPKSLSANVLELSAQCSILSKDWKEAEEYLSRADKLFTGVDTTEAFFIRKWKLILELYQSPHPKDKAEAFENLKQEAIRLKHWESVRECDYWRALKTRDANLMIHVYFGTPYNAYRKRIFRLYPEQLNLPESYPWDPNESGKKNLKAIELFEKGSSKTQLFNPKSLSHRLLVILLSDFYRPLPMGVVHAKLYPGDFFNPDSSPVKVYQAVTVLRKGLADAKIPIQILDTQEGYRLSIDKGYCITIPKVSMSSGTTTELDLLKTRFKNELFTAPEVEKVLKISRSSVNRLIKKAIEEGTLEKEGHGYAVIYRFTK